MKILIAVDGSDSSLKATRHIASNIGWFRDPELHLLYVQLPIPTGRARAIAGEETVQHYYEEEAKDALGPAEKVLQEMNIPFQSRYAVGDVPDQIEAHAKEHGIDMVVTGTHGRGMLQKMVIGSVATKILATSSVPVLIVR